MKKVNGGEIVSQDMGKADLCSCVTIHDDVVKRVLEKMPDEDTILELGDTFKLFGDPTRLKILSALMQSEMCTCDLSALLKMTQSAISHQLRVLKQSNLVKNRRDGKVVYYSIADDHVKTIFNNGMDHVLE